MKKTLLERAKSLTKPASVRREYTEEDAEFAVAWLFGEVSLTQVIEIKEFRTKRGALSGARAYSYLALALKKAAKDGLLRR